MEWGLLQILVNNFLEGENFCILFEIQFLVS